MLGDNIRNTKCDDSLANTLELGDSKYKIRREPKNTK